MSRRTREINRVTGGIISISLKLILLALVCILMYEGVTRGYSFGHEVFAPAPMAQGEGVSRQVTVEKGMSAMETGKLLKAQGLIPNEYVFAIEASLYEYEIHPGTYTFNTAQTSMDMLQMLDDSPGVSDEETEEKE